MRTVTGAKQFPFDPHLAILEFAYHDDIGIEVKYHAYGLPEEQEAWEDRIRELLYNKRDFVALDRSKPVKMVLRIEVVREDVDG